jgi:uncharacterized protein (TIGR02246 family)
MGGNDLILEIRSLNARWMEDYEMGDAAAVGSHYTEDAISLPPHTPAVVGRESIIEYWREAMKSGPKGLNIQTEEVERDGELACEIGETDLIGPDEDVIDRFHYMVVWKRVGDKWLIHREIWNSSLKK